MIVMIIIIMIIDVISIMIVMLAITITKMRIMKLMVYYPVPLQASDSPFQIAELVWCICVIEVTYCLVL